MVPLMLDMFGGLVHKWTPPMVLDERDLSVEGFPLGQQHRVGPARVRNTLEAGRPAMVDQDEIDLQVRAWIVAQTGKDEDDSNGIYKRWEQFVLAHDDETAEALRRSAIFEGFRLLDALTEGVLNELQTGIPLDECVVEHIRQGGTPSFKGDRDKVRHYFEVGRTAFEQLGSS